MLGILITVLSKVLAIQIPSLIGNTLKVVEEFNKGIIKSEQIVKHTLLINILLIVGAALLSGFFTFLMRQTIIVMSRFIEYDLKNEIFKQYENLSLSFYKKNRTGDLMNRISEDVGKVRMYVGPAIMYTINMLVLFAVALVKMFSIDKTLTFYALMPLPILSVSIYLLSKIIHKRSTKVQQYLSKLTTFVQEIFSGIQVIKAYVIEDYTSDKFKDLTTKSKDVNLSLYKAQALFFPLMILLIGISNLLVVYIGGMRYINGEITNIGVIAEFIIYVNMLTWPVAVVGWVTSIVQQAEASQKRINEFLKIKPEIKNEVKEPTPIQGEIAFENVSFTYPDTNIKALKNISFKIKKGETLAIIGHTGSGKSTIANFVARMYDTQKGKVKIDNTWIKKLNLKDLRSSIGFVPQDAFLFSETIKNNIKFGKENATDKEVIEAAKNAYIHHNIRNFKEGYETLVGERGVTLSGGQKQRISIARAIIKKPKILILDDCLSAVDTETEEQILTNLEQISKNSTTLIISHRISSIKHANHIIVLEKGKIIEEGTHNELLNINGYYKQIFEQQQLENILD